MDRQADRRINEGTEDLKSRYEIERAIVCAAFAGAETIDCISSLISDSDFVGVDTRTIWAAQRKLAEDNEPIDAITVLGYMERHHNVPANLGIDTLIDLRSSSWESAHVEYYCGKLREHATSDGVRALGVQLAGETNADSDTIDRYIVRLDEIRQGRKDEIHSAAEAVDSMLEHRQNPRKIHKTGIWQLDQKLKGGMRDGQVIVIGGRPGTGKSVLLTQICLGVAQRGEAALIASLEMPKEEITERIAATQSIEAIRNMPLLFIDHTSDFGVISSLVKIACRRHSVGVVAIDYIQLCEVKHGGRENREQQIAMISRRIKRLAGDIKCPIVIGSQLNRESTKRSKPSLADLRESGSVEQDGDIVILLSKGEEDDETTIDVAKHRGGPTGEIKMKLVGPLFQFEDVSQDYSGFDK